MSVLLKTEPPHRSMKEIAEKAYTMADAMLAARKAKAATND